MVNNSTVFTFMHFVEAPNEDDSAKMYTYFLLAGEISYVATCDENAGGSLV